ncbi:MAG: MFS transporter [Verrucomicrobiota bacterium]|nr:MFS transporter [Verrucomicrobiota bacterium]
MSSEEIKTTARRNVRCFTLFRALFSARFYYPVYALLFLDYGLTLGQFGILNGLWAVTIFLLEIPSGALADTIGRRKLLILGAVCMLLEMGVLLVAPIGGGTWLFVLFAFNRILSGVAEAAVSGADEALAYDSLKAACLEGEWGKVMERVQRVTSLTFFFTMFTGAAVYDSYVMNTILQFFGVSSIVEQTQLIKLPILLTFFSGIAVLWMALGMKEPPAEEGLTISETLTNSWRLTSAAVRWIWATPLPFAIILAAMAIDSVVRQFLTLASEYWSVIELPIASYGLIGSGMALMGLFVPRIARLLTENSTPVKNFLITTGVVMLGLMGLGLAIPAWGILPAVLLYASIQLMGFFVSRYLNEAAPSEQRATVLSFRGLSTNFSYGAVSIMYSGLIAWIKTKLENSATDEATQHLVFVESLQFFPWYFAFTVLIVFAIHWMRFGRKS